MKRSKEQASETIVRLIEVARKHFTEHGYAESSMEDIVAEANLTRGALYHHFGSKKGLFQAVLESVQSEIGVRVEADAMQSDDAWEQLIRGCRSFVAAAVEPRNKRILLIDGPAVLGWEAWRRMDEENSMRHLREQLGLLQQQGSLKPVPLDAMTHFLSGALNESALWIAQSPDEGGSLEDTITVITLVLKGICND
ncbi:TetR/AcrR family transcriptional regulator [Paenibacillus harenae]|uniref:TetR/AcrR family transcriptional regulator n=1 Tax=Paenibacillus harenae TaxID=306543 RepID=UPI0004119B88|nr:TetR/AcrR family transcriptional regulator [Paenibacillus harenae]